MYKIAILGCENSHANAFLDIIFNKNIYSDIEVLGVYSDDTEAANKLHDTYGVYVAANYDEFVGKADGIMITARHGDNHYKYAAPYITACPCMFIDKPITVTEEDAGAFKALLIQNEIKVSGGSSLKHPDAVHQLKSMVLKREFGSVYGGFARAPVSLINNYGNFSFYSQHLIQILGEIFGYYPNSVKAYVNGDVVTCIVRYTEYDVTITYINGDYKYAAGINCTEKIIIEEFTSEGGYEKEFAEFYDILTGKEQPQSYDDFFAPVYIMNAIMRSMESGQEELIHRG